MSLQIINNTYKFECTMCGNCCTGDQKVNLNLYDLYKIATYKGFRNTSQLFAEKTIQLVKGQNNAWVPQIKFKSLKRSDATESLRKNYIFCPFLINELDDQHKLKGLCSLHPDIKPLICAMAPIGRVLDFENRKEDFVFVKPASDCPGVESQKENLLNDFKDNFSDELAFELRFFRIMNNLMAKNKSYSFYLENIYTFSTIEPFEYFLNQLEHTFN